MVSIYIDPDLGKMFLLFALLYVIEQNDINNIGSKTCPNENPFYLDYNSISLGHNHMTLGLF